MLGSGGRLRATQTGADLLWRVPARNRLPVLERLADGSIRSIIHGSGQDRRHSRGECLIRVVEYRIAGAGDEVFRIATTLLDPEHAPATEFAALYHERWENEAAYDEVELICSVPAQCCAARPRTLCGRKWTD